MLTNGLHDELWIGAFRKVPVIADKLEQANAIACAKELYAIGELSKDGYAAVMKHVLEANGFKIK